MLDVNGWICFRAKIKAGQSLLVHGASGAVGTAAVQIAKRKGLNNCITSFF
jgi:NADPH:quinone reductase-like Zn-dependent oxidoreductase